ncbi:MAG: DUF2254 domain-containing protein [Actinomycetes bacterium]
MAANGEKAREPASLDWLSKRERSRRWGLWFRLREWLQGSLIIVPSIYLVGVLILSFGVPQVERNGDMLKLDVASSTGVTLLSSIAGGMIAFTGLVVSIAVLVVQFSAGQYSPRLVSRFRRDPILKHSLGVFIAPALYSLITLRNIGQDGGDVAPSLTIGVAFALFGAAILSFFVLVGRLLDLLRPRRLVAHLVEQGAHAATEVYPFRYGQAPADPDPGGDEVGKPTVLSFPGSPAVLIALDRGRLVREATRADVVIELTVGVGAYLPREAPIIRVHRHADSGEVNEAEVQRSLMVGDGRTITQDPGFAVRVMVDVAARALSPAINDPTTAVEVLDGLETVLLALSWRDLRRGQIADSEGRLRLTFPNPGWEELLDLSLTEIRRFGAGSPQVTRRMRALLNDLLAHTPDERDAAVLAQLARFEAAVRAAVSDPVELEYALTADRLGIGTVAPR